MVVRILKRWDAPVGLVGPLSVCLTVGQRRLAPSGATLHPGWALSSWYTIAHYYRQRPYLTEGNPLNRMWPSLPVLACFMAAYGVTLYSEVAQRLWAVGVGPEDTSSHRAHTLGLGCAQWIPGLVLLLCGLPVDRDARGHWGLLSGCGSDLRLPDGLWGDGDMPRHVRSLCRGLPLILCGAFGRINPFWFACSNCGEARNGPISGPRRGGGKVS